MKEKIRVLLVDDEEQFVINMARILKVRGFNVSTAFSGYEAVDVIKYGGGFDVVVLDVKMPGMDGHEALRNMKILKPDLEVIMLTGYGTVESSLEAWGDSVFTYLTKPCDIDILAEKIRDAAAKRRGLDNALAYFMWSRRKDEG